MIIAFTNHVSGEPGPAQPRERRGTAGYRDARHSPGYGSEAMIFIRLRLGLWVLRTSST